MGHTSKEAAQRDQFAETILNSILVIDDDPETAEATKQFLTEKGYYVNLASSGGQAYGHLRMHKADFVILKLILPDESGFEICDRIKRDYEWTPVLVWSEINLDASRQLAVRVRADGYLTRPCEFDLLLKTLKDIAKTVWMRYEESRIKHNSDESPDDTTIGMSPQLDSQSGINGSEVKTRTVEVIHFHCNCGKQIDAKYRDRGRFIFCASCQERVRVPQCSDQDFLDRSSQNEDDAVAPSDPMKFVTVRCQNCGTFFRLYSAALKVNKTCPRCHQEQTGSLSIKGVPLSKAALASSMRLLRICSGKQKGKKILLPDKEVILGKGKGAHLKHNAPNLEDHHCTLKPVEEGIVVRDLGSVSGTWVNGDRVEGKAILPPNGVLQVGALLLRLLAKERSVEDAVKRIQKWSVEEEEASASGEDVYRQSISIPQEAAAIIEMYWDVSRKKLANDSTE